MDDMKRKINIVKKIILGINFLIKMALCGTARFLRKVL